MSNQTQPNPDALEAAYIAVSDESWLGATAAREVAKAAVSAYLAAAPPEVTTVQEVARLWRQVSEAIDHEHLDPREFVDLGDLKFLLGQILDSFRPEVNDA